MPVYWFMAVPRVALESSTLPDQDVLSAPTYPSGNHRTRETADALQRLLPHFHRNHRYVVDVSLLISWISRRSHISRNGRCFLIVSRRNFRPHRFPNGQCFRRHLLRNCLAVESCHVEQIRVSLADSDRNGYRKSWPRRRVFSLDTDRRAQRKHGTGYFLRGRSWNWLMVAERCRAERFRGNPEVCLHGAEPK